MRFIDIRGVVVNLGDGDRSELFPEVVEWNEEDPVIFVWMESDSVLFLLVHVVPVLVVIRPSSLELSLSPRISQLNQPNLLSIDIQIINFQKSVGVTLHNT